MRGWRGEAEVVCPRVDTDSPRNTQLSRRAREAVSTIAIWHYGCLPQAAGMATSFMMVVGRMGIQPSRVLDPLLDPGAPAFAGGSSVELGIPGLPLLRTDDGPARPRLARSTNRSCACLPSFVSQPGSNSTCSIAAALPLPLTHRTLSYPIRPGEHSSNCSALPSTN